MTISHSFHYSRLCTVHLRGELNLQKNQESEKSKRKAGGLDELSECDR